jgi:hypothetical protein
MSDAARMAGGGISSVEHKDGWQSLASIVFDHPSF